MIPPDWWFEPVARAASYAAGVLAMWLWLRGTR